jgi:hypothetical protein
MFSISGSRLRHSPLAFQFAIYNQPPFAVEMLLLFDTAAACFLLPYYTILSFRSHRDFTDFKAVIVHSDTVETIKKAFQAEILDF